jgi:hypothetical protein
LPFRPFGFFYTITSPHPPEVCRARLRAAVSTRDLNVEEWPPVEGWIWGRYGAFGESSWLHYRPRVSGWIGADGTGSKISGLGGRGLLVGVLSTFCFAPALFISYHIFTKAGDGPSLEDIGINLLIYLLGVFCMWAGHHTRMEALWIAEFMAEAVEGDLIVR